MGEQTKRLLEYVAGDNDAGANGVKFFHTQRRNRYRWWWDYREVGLNLNQVINTLLYCRSDNAAWIQDKCCHRGVDPDWTWWAIERMHVTNCNRYRRDHFANDLSRSRSRMPGFTLRSVGIGNIYFTRDGGTNWTDITSLINNSTFTLVKIENKRLQTASRIQDRNERRCDYCRRRN